MNAGSDSFCCSNPNQTECKDKAGYLCQSSLDETVTTLSSINRLSCPGAALTECGNEALISVTNDFSSLTIPVTLSGADNQVCSYKVDNSGGIALILDGTLGVEIFKSDLTPAAEIDNLTSFFLLVSQPTTL